ncbi:hypothetical protein ID866_4790 [Astraeus odoratus]|nr:hypothetical protein ID866_4790 [Astraeus odoratus]
MPKSAKKKKEKVADFTKAKLKLGKGKKLPNNVVDTSFKARNAILSARELFEDFPELISTSIAPLFAATARLIGDEDPGVRKTLLLFFEWLLPRVPKVGPSLTTRFCRSHLSHQEDLIPHAPICLLFVTSAQTHIFPEIRLDAVRYLDLFIEILPQHVVAGWDEDGSGIGRRILDGYLGLLSSGIRFGSSKGPFSLISLPSAGNSNVSCQIRRLPHRQAL